MNDEALLRKCEAYIESHMDSIHSGAPASASNIQLPSITFCGLAGAGGLLIAEKLAEYLDANTPRTVAGWTVFDRNLVAKVIEDHEMSESLAAFMPEDAVPAITDMIEEMVGLHPSSLRLFRQTSETILQLLNLGKVIILGRGANIIAAGMDYVFNVRIVGSLERRLERIQTECKLDHKQAMEYIRHEDGGRARYVKDHFNKNVDDPLLYHLVVNTDHFSLTEAAEAIGGIAMKRFRWPDDGSR